MASPDAGDSPDGISRVRVLRLGETLVTVAVAPSTVTLGTPGKKPVNVSVSLDEFPTVAGETAVILGDP
jgi:hypothetical protein